MTIDTAIEACVNQRNLTKATQTLLGICSGIAADGHVNDHEIAFLRTWLSEHKDIAAVWPGSAIARRIDEVVADGVVTADERESLLAALRQASGNTFSETGTSTLAAPSIPLDDDPSIFFRNMTFCFTGNFYYGTRACCERAVLKAEAMAVDRVTSKLDYLVVGSVIEESWANTTYGRKIETAIQRRSRYGSPCIVSEEQWVKALQDAMR